MQLLSTKTPPYAIPESLCADMVREREATKLWKGSGPHVSLRFLKTTSFSRPWRMRRAVGLDAPMRTTHRCWAATAGAQQPSLKHMPTRDAFASMIYRRNRFPSQHQGCQTSAKFKIANDESSPSGTRFSKGAEAGFGSCRLLATKS